MKNSLLLAASLLLLSMSLMAQGSSAHITDSKNGLPIASKFVWGGNIGLAYYNGWLIDIAPSLGYRFTPNIVAGVGVSYTYLSHFNSQQIDNKLTFNTVGGNIFFKYAPFATIEKMTQLKKLFLQAEAEYLHVTGKETYQGTPIRTINGNVPGLFLGAGYASDFLGRGYSASVLYNVLWRKDNLFYPLPIKIRFGFNF